MSSAELCGSNPAWLLTCSATHLLAPGGRLSPTLAPALASALSPDLAHSLSLSLPLSLTHSLSRSPALHASRATPRVPVLAYRPSQPALLRGPEG